jgi:hypothetical protein
MPVEDESDDMLIPERVVDVFALAASHDEPFSVQHSEPLRHGGTDTVGRSESPPSVRR